MKRTKQPLSKRRRMYRKRPFNIRRARSPKPSQMVCKRTFWLENWSPNTATTAGFWRYYQVSMNSMPSVGEFTPLFDQYRINAIKFTFRPRYDSFAGNDTVDTTLPGVTNQGGTQLHIINDPYSIIGASGTYNSTNLNTFLEQGSVKSYNGNRAVSVYYKPTINKTVDGAAGGNNVERARAPFLNANNTSVVHNGFHVFAQDINLTGAFGQSFDVFVTFYMTWKNLR